jgi:ABC-type lipoprotein release transport system permease subunit
VEDRGIADVDNLVARVRRVHGVTSVTPYVEGKVLLGYDGRSDVNKVVIVKGVQESADGSPHMFAERVAFGEAPKSDKHKLPPTSSALHMSIIAVLTFQL